MSLSIVVLAMRVCGQHANLLQEVLKLSCLLGCVGEDQLLLGHGLSVAGRIEFFVQDFDSCGKLDGFLIKLVKVGDLPSHPSVIKVFNFTLQVHKVATRPEKEGMEPGREWFDRVFFAMLNCVSLHIQIDNVRGLIRALALVITGNSAIFQPLDPFGRMVDSIAEGNIEVGYLPVILDIAVGAQLNVFL